MSTTASAPTADSMPTTRNYGSVPVPTQVDEENPTQDPFTAPAESSTTNYMCCGVFLLPLAALGGLMDQLSRKFSRHTLPKA